MSTVILARHVVSHLDQFNSVRGWAVTSGTREGGTLEYDGEHRGSMRFQTAMAGSSIHATFENPARNSWTQLRVDYRTTGAGPSNLLGLRVYEGADRTGRAAVDSVIFSGHAITDVQLRDMALPADSGWQAEKAALGTSAGHITVEFYVGRHAQSVWIDNLVLLREPRPGESNFVGAAQ